MCFIRVRVRSGLLQPLRQENAPGPDYQEDFVVIKSIYEALYPKNSYFTLEDIIDWLHSNPEIFKINSHIHFDLDNFYKKDRKQE